LYARYVEHRTILIMEILNKHFRELNTTELFKIYELRALVFVVEQNCPYQDVDTLDLMARHVLFMQGDQLVAYARIMAGKTEGPESKIGRVVVHPDFRGQTIGKDLMKYCIHQALELSENKEIVISAQAYLLRFYTDLGFKAEGAEYLEDTIPHWTMRLKS